MTSVAKEIALLGIFALGAGVVIIAGGIDLSSGSVICFAGVLSAKTPEWSARLTDGLRQYSWCPRSLVGVLDSLGLGHADEPLSLTMIGLMVLLPLLSGWGIGLFHSLLISRLELPPFVATLGTMAGLRSLANVVTTGTIAMSDARVRSIGDNWQAPLIFFGVECLLLALVLHATPVGRHLYALGGNEPAARLSGLDVVKLQRLSYVFGSMTATIAGLIYMAHVGGASSQTGVGYELAAIAAVVVGGCNLKGGAGSVVGIVLGVVLLRLVINGTLFVIDVQATEWEGFIVGMVVILAALLGKLGARTN